MAESIQRRQTLIIAKSGSRNWETLRRFVPIAPYEGASPKVRGFGKGSVRLGVMSKWILASARDYDKRLLSPTGLDECYSYSRMTS